MGEWKMNRISKDAVIIGAGVVGVSIFNDLTRSGYDVAIIEKELDVSTGTTKANSGLIHAGFDCKPNTLKAKLNVEGNAMYPEICARLGVELKRLGAYVVGNDEEAVNNLMEKGKANGVKGMKKLSNSALHKLLPNLTPEMTTGLFAENAYIIDPYFYTICLAEEGVINGGEIYFDYHIKSIKQTANGYVISNGKEEIITPIIFNAAGAGYNDVAKLLKSELYNVVHRRGEYYVLDHSEKDVVKSTIFPLPTKAGKGVLVTPTVNGNILVGPTSYESDDTTVTTAEGLADIATKVKKMVDNVNLGKTIRVFAGVRSIVGEDFVIEPSQKCKGVINIAGICSPGLSSAPAISQMAIGLSGLKYDPTIRCNKIAPYTNLSKMSVAEKNALIRRDKDYGLIVCKCEGITLGEIKDAINRPIRPRTMDGIKRRVRAGMGRCQGGFCNDKVAMIISQENNIPLNSVVKEKSNGYYMLSRSGVNEKL